jgi:hypothetical protein
MKKTVIFGLLIILLAFGFICCDNENGKDDKPKSKWWIWMSSVDETNYNATARVSITPNSNDSGCDVVVTGSPNGIYNSWATQVICDYTATIGKKYKVTWKWIANGYPFKDVTIRYAQQKNYQNDDNYELGTNTVPLTIPTTEETKEYEFTMPDNCYMNFTFMIGNDTGSFKIYDFKVE